MLAQDFRRLAMNQAAIAAMKEPSDDDAEGSTDTEPSPVNARPASMDLDPLSRLLRKNKAWSAARAQEDPDYFNKLLNQQAPEYLWIGCSDSRVPANAILGLAPGEVFVQRNVGNQATHTDLNCMSCLEYAVKELKVRVRNIIVCGHYGCGAVKGALKLPSKTTNLVNCWISDIRQCRNEHRSELMALPTLEAQIDRLCELNVLRQTFHVATTSTAGAASYRSRMDAFNAYMNTMANDT
ncbi:Carbonic anhydrase 2 [Tetrabaena socialis]|uniref:Carbonic anhydrase n=1 Tax=Tetrabaena socialis TaxID=47790 RepID=A0A2J8ACI1_9CHLO|nr:Carbonic anhydrase 2 [Tetrabaena socialis]|eukprot:PNH10217.1 Carbonic anhydrase 2 [Tetrabaena socialis]